MHTARAEWKCRDTQRGLQSLVDAWTEWTDTWLCPLIVRGVKWVG